MSEDPDKTVPMDRDAFEAELAAQHRETLPIPFIAAIAKAQGVDAVECPACSGCGLVSSDVAARVALAIGDDFDEEAPITAVEDVTTQPTGPRGR